ncbi:heavy metal translocating P-type ATPase [Miltoncostaea marina]|uniref:heavy metal translocating P-type ATPase n=1 Tax=Miltoncostaea marina TaxID=2843215 RepID=UPI001C3C24BE|nr:heavy metal translocating P-type ATPase [Miltoncostaea marina]
MLSGLLLWALGLDVAADAVWSATTVLVLAPLVLSVARALTRGDLGVDVIALLAMAGALALGEYLAAAVVALMMSGGEALEALAAGRSRRELAALLARAPRTATLRRDGALVEVPADAVGVGDLVVVRAGEVLPVDGLVEGGSAVLDQAALTGEPLPVEIPEGGAVRSGSTNAGAAIDVRATRPAAESAYAAIVRLVREAGAQRAPFVRMADRYAVVFLAVTLALAGLAWAVSGDPVRALAVLVVATPCPLILAAPIALVAGVSRAARRGVIVKGAGVIEALGGARAVLLDKTGTLTLGTPEVEDVVAADGRSADEVLRLAASVEQLSMHVLGQALVDAAAGRELRLSLPADVVEDPGFGVQGRVDGARVVAGAPDWVRGQGVTGVEALGVAAGAGRAVVAVGIDGRAAGAVVFGDRLRDDASATVERMRRTGIEQIAMVTGDERSVAEEVAARVGVDRVHADQTPADKLDVVRAMRADGAGVVMVGDGINDAPALAMADVGIAVGSIGASASTEAADAIVAVDEIGRIADAVEIGRRSIGIARQSVLVGMGLSIAAMIVAAAGHLPPVGGALLQEAIDVAVILNALRALTGPRG